MRSADWRTAELKDCRTEKTAELTTMSFRKLFYQFPPSLRLLVRRLYFLPADTWDSLTGRREKMTPPRGLIFTGGGDFRKTGETLRGYFQDLCGLRPNGKVLDVGSGMGRSAIPLTEYLNSEGRYEGFDVMKRGVDWCQKNINAKFPNFNFKYIPLKNDLYRADGGNAVQFKFPYPDDSFDLAVVNSVFTHMLPDEVDNYLGEIYRVLRPGGKCYSTFFVFDEKMENSFPAGFEFPHDHGHYRLMDDKVKSANVAFAEKNLREDLVGKNGFKLKSMYLGSWRGLPRKDCMEFQDIVILEK